MSETVVTKRKKKFAEKKLDSLLSAMKSLKMEIR